MTRTSSFSSRGVGGTNGEKPRAARGFIGLLVRLDRALLGPSALHVSPRDRNVLGGDVKVSHLVVSVRVHAGLVFRVGRHARGKRRDDLRWGRIGRSRWIRASDRNVGAVATALGLRPAFLGNLAGLTRPRGSRVRVSADLDTAAEAAEAETRAEP